MKISIVELIKESREELAFPKVAMRILKLFEDNDLSTYQLAKVIALDPVLAAYILKISNSAFYSFSGKVKTLSEAITLIGFEEVRKIVIMIGAKNAFRVGDLYDEILWRHSLAVAVASSIINSQTRTTQDGTAYVAGLLHDIGKVVLKRSKSLNYIDILKQVYESSMESRFLEEEEYGYNHADIGGYLLKEWEFDQEIIDSVAFHHLNFTLVRSEIFLKKAALINLADFIVNDIMGIGKRDGSANAESMLTLPSARILGFFVEDPLRLIERIDQRFTVLKSIMDEEI